MISNLGLISETVSGIYNKTLTRTYTTAFGKGKVLSMSIGNVNNYTYDYDTYGRLNKITTPAGDFIYTRPSDSDLVTAMARPNNVTSNWTFEVHRNLLSQVANGSVSTYTYTNDALGRRTNVTRSGSAFSDTNILTYGYNSRSEVISALSNINANYNFAYSYDPIGNRLNSTLAGTAWSYTSNNLNQYTALTSGNTTQSPAYDADGNMTFRDGWTQVWNGENRLVEMYNDTAKLTFSYDYMGRRIEKKVFQQTGGIWAPQKSLQYVYDGYKLVEEIDTLPDEKPVIRRYTWQPESQGADLPLVVTDVASNQSYFYTADGNKNISELVDAAGNVAAHYEYDPFGKINTQNGAYAASNPFRFSSEYFDSETGLVYYNYRYYSPQMGRWINRDPIGEAISYNLFRSNIFQFAIERPPSFSIKATKMKNSYLILLNDPIMMFDHLGLLEMNVCCDNAQLMWPLNYLRHCEISLGACPSGRDWVTYPIKVDVSKDRKMDNGISCACANEQDIKNCMKRHPYSAGNGTWGSNCQTSVIKTLANCCLSTTWSPNLYAGSPRGACKKYTSIITPDGIPIAVCIEWEYPEWRK